MLQKSNDRQDNKISRGGYRPGSGRPKKKDTVVIRIDKDLLPIIELLKTANPQCLESAVLALNGQDAFTSLMDFLRPYRD